MNKQLIYIVGGVAVVGIGYYLYSQNKKKSNALDGGVATGGAEKGGAEKGGAEKGGAETGGAETGGGTKTGIKLKDLKGSEKRDMRGNTKDICREKYNKGKDFLDCKKRVNKGGVAFDGSDFDAFRNDYIDFSGLNFDL